MPDGMPFMKQKGNPLVNLEQWLPQTRAAAWQMLVDAHNPDRRMGDVLSDHLVSGGDPAVQGLIDTFIVHVRRDWFGETYDGVWHEQPRFGEAPVTGGERRYTTGFWQGWYGDAEAIVRTAVIRTIELMLHLHPVDYPFQNGKLDAPAKVEAQYGAMTPITAHVPITPPDIWWLCPQPRFEAAVERTEGRVRLEFMTPPPSGGVLGSGYRENDYKNFEAGSPPMVPTKIRDVLSVVGKGGKAHPQSDVKQYAEANEAWMVSQNYVKPYTVFTLQYDPFVSKFTFANPFTIVVSSDEAVTVDPTQPFGGRP